MNFKDIYQLTLIFDLDLGNDPLESCHLCLSIIVLSFIKKTFNRYF
jgi:hypothetical protein